MEKGKIMAYVDVPKDLTNIKTKFIGNFTKRQCICFGIGMVVGFPGYFIVRGFAGTTPAFYSLIAIMAPFFLFGIVEKDGLPLKNTYSILYDIVLLIRNFGLQGQKIYMSFMMRL